MQKKKEDLVFGDRFYYMDEIIEFVKFEHSHKGRAIFRNSKGRELYYYFTTTMEYLGNYAKSNNFKTIYQILNDEL